MGKRIDGKQLAQQIYLDLKKDIARLRTRGITPHLAILLIGNNSASEVYVAKKQAAAQELGMRCTVFRFKTTVKKAEVIACLETLQQPTTDVTGIIVQLPIPEHLYASSILQMIKPSFDVDCLTYESFGKLALGNHSIEPPTAGAIMTILRSQNIELTGKKVAIVGMGSLVGKPVALLLINERATVLTANSATKPLSVITKQADIVITGVGKAGLIRGSMLKKGALVVDAGIAFDRSGKVVGDVAMKSVEPIVSAVTPTPGGVGPLTVALLLKNTLILAQKKSHT